jgi:hypothetical protein
LTTFLRTTAHQTMSEIEIARVMTSAQKKYQVSAPKKAVRAAFAWARGEGGGNMLLGK